MKTTPHTLASRQQRLLARIHRSYVTRTQIVRFGPLNFEFTRIADPDRVLDQVAAEADRRERVSGKRESDDHLHLPYWAELWDSAAGIGQFLTREGDAGTWGHGDAEKERNTKTTFPGIVPASPRPRVSASLSSPVSASLSSKPTSLSSKTLDLGCGMGLSGTVAAALGASVLFADIEPPALLFAQLNSLPFSDRVRTRRLNWQTDRLHEQFDLILGADILYERSQWEFLEPFWRHHLAPGGTLLLGEPGRQTGDLFIQWIVQREWKLGIFEEKVPSRERPVRILNVSRP